MEQVRTARRSASHGALNTRYATDSDFYPRMVSSSHPFARPLRSVNENTCLLPSPGPLESMLRTTTETGDIGIFSIRPSRSSASVHAPLRPKRGFGDTSWQRPPRINRTDTPGFRDDRSRFPRYRDTASEIISMYGSGSQRSASSSYDDMAQRGYSMTSCGSRPRALPNKKSNSTLRSQASGTYRQRPRSPFPYPTRLRRPGVRPSSPAWTDNGGVDYSRMVQLDRHSHRTVHGLYKPTYPHYAGRRATPGLSRFDINRSVPSLSSYNTQPGLQYTSGQTSSAPTTWGGRFRDRLDGGRSDNSLRSSSITSIVDMYRPPSCAPMGQDHYFRAQSVGAYYYDYSEDFDPVPSIVRPPLPPLAPVPTRGPSLHRPMVLNEGCGMNLDGTNNQDLTNELHAMLAVELGSGEEAPEKKDFPPPMGSLPNSLSGLAPGVSTNPLASDLPESEQLPLYKEDIGPVGENTPRHPKPAACLVRDSSNLPEDHERSVLAAASSPEVQEHTGDQAPFISVNSDDVAYEEPTRASAVSQARSSAQPSGIHQSMSLSCGNKESISSPASEYLRRSKLYSIEPGLSDLASLVQCLDKAGQRSLLEDNSFDTAISEHQDLEACASQEPTLSELCSIQTTRAGNLPISDPKVYENGEGERSGDFRAHRRHHAVSSFHTNAPLAAAERDSLQERECTVPIFAPQPISPVRRLKLQNSVPQLMKALPPLPNPRGSESSSRTISPGRLDVSMCFSPEYRLDDTTVLKEHEEYDGDFKSNNKKLKLKVSRRRVCEAPVSSGQSVVSKPSGFWFQDSPENPQHDQNDCDREFITASIERQSEDCATGLEASIEDASFTSRPDSTGSVVRHVDIGNAESLSGDSVVPQKTLHSSSAASISDLRSTLSNGSTGSQKPPRGLRKRVSYLRIRLAESRLKSAEPQVSLEKQNIDVGVGTTSTLAPSSSTIGADDFHENKSSADELGRFPAVQSRGFRGRMSKWMATVRQAVMVACTGSRKRG